MEAQLIVAYCTCDDIVKSLKICEQKHARMNLAEVMTTALAAAMFFGGNQERARAFMCEGHYVNYMLSKGQFNRRLHQVGPRLWQVVFEKIAAKFKAMNLSKEYAVDSFPIAVCHKARIKRCKIYSDKKYLGCVASKEEYFYGLRLHMVTTNNGSPVEMLLKPGSIHDLKVFKEMKLAIPRKSIVYADSAYLDYRHESNLFNKAKILLLSQRRSNSKQRHSLAVELRGKRKRKVIETAFSKLEKLLPRSIHAFSSAGFELKLLTFVVALAISMIN